MTSRGRWSADQGSISVQSPPSTPTGALFTLWEYLSILSESDQDNHVGEIKENLKTGRKRPDMFSMNHAMFSY